MKLKLDELEDKLSKLRDEYATAVAISLSQPESRDSKSRRDALGSQIDDLIDILRLLRSEDVTIRTFEPAFLNLLLESCPKFHADTHGSAVICAEFLAATRQALTATNTPNHMWVPIVPKKCDPDTAAWIISTFSTYTPWEEFSSSFYGRFSNTSNPYLPLLDLLNLQREPNEKLRNFFSCY